MLSKTSDKDKHRVTSRLPWIDHLLTLQGQGLQIDGAVVILEQPPRVGPVPPVDVVNRFAFSQRSDHITEELPDGEWRTTPTPTETIFVMGADSKRL